LERRGDRVLVAFDIACGSCFFCNSQLFSSCDKTNPSEVTEMMYGQRTAGIYGYSHLTGGYAGGQAEFVRVPLGEWNKPSLQGSHGIDLLAVIALYLKP
jgi:threonine dehydrogenase-like Zn-dependent dehydrogenase